MAKYDLKKMDSGCLQLLSEAIKQKYQSMIGDLISVSRASSSFNYVSNKNSIPTEQKRINYQNQQKRETQSKGFDIIFTSNTGLELKSILDEEGRRVKAQMQEEYLNQEELKAEKDKKGETDKQATANAEDDQAQEEGGAG